jgi:hypothetical protein
MPHPLGVPCKWWGSCLQFLGASPANGLACLVFLDSAPGRCHGTMFPVATSRCLTCRVPLRWSVVTRVPLPCLHVPSTKLSPSPASPDLHTTVILHTVLLFFHLIVMMTSVFSVRCACSSSLSHVPPLVRSRPASDVGSRHQCLLVRE